MEPRIKKDILATLAYFNMFEYPLKKREIFLFLGRPAALQDFESSLLALTEETAIFKLGEFYSLRDNYSIAERRRKGNEKAAEMLKKAEKAAEIISFFPFVKGVSVSGSLSKNFADENADIDFFIITDTNRLWIARSFLHLFKKFTFLTRNQHSYCMNYFVDEEGLCILEKNIYTATEVATVLPMRGDHVFDKFYAANRWTKEFLPNNYMHVSSAKPLKHNGFVKVTEKLLNNFIGNALDNFLMKITRNSWNAKKRRQLKNVKGQPMGMHAGKHFSKPDPTDFQEKLLKRYERCLSEVLNMPQPVCSAKNNTW